MLGATSSATVLLLLLVIGLARRNAHLRDELAAARWTIAEKLEKEMKTRPAKVYVVRNPPQNPGSAA